MGHYYLEKNKKEKHALKVLEMLELKLQEIDRLYDSKYDAFTHEQKRTEAFEGAIRLIFSF